MMLKILLTMFFLVYSHLCFSQKVLENFLPNERHFLSKCENLNVNECLETSGCGWLIDGYEYSRCLDGTPVGPLNPKLQPDAENSRRKNVQHDSWIYANPNPFIFYK